MPKPEVNLLVDCHAAIGDSPTWHTADESLYGIDIKEPALHRLDAEGTLRRWTFEAEIDAFALTGDAAAAVVALRTGLFRHDLGGGTTAPLAFRLSIPPCSGSRKAFATRTAGSGWA